MSGAENQNESAKRSVPSFDGEDGGEKADARRRVHTAVGRARNRAKGGGRPASTYTRPCASWGRSAPRKRKPLRPRWRPLFFLPSRHHAHQSQSPALRRNQSPEGACAGG